MDVLQTLVLTTEDDHEFTIELTSDTPQYLLNDLRAMADGQLLEVAFITNECKIKVLARGKLLEGRLYEPVDFEQDEEE